MLNQCSVIYVSPNLTEKLVINLDEAIFYVAQCSHYKFALRFILFLFEPLTV